MRHSPTLFPALLLLLFLGGIHVVRGDDKLAKRSIALGRKTPRMQITVAERFVHPCQPKSIRHIGLTVPYPHQSAPPVKC
jgi:hypothetical protein